MLLSIVLSIIKFALNLSLFANCRSQFLLDRLGRCIKLIVSSESISCHEFASQFGLEFVSYAKNPKPIVNTESPACCLLYFNGPPTCHCLASVESGAPNHGVMVGRTDTATVVGGVCVFASVSVRACMRACVMCLQYTIIIFYPGW